MDAELAVNQVLDDEGLTSDLDEAEASFLVRWLVGEVEAITKKADTDENGWKQIKAKRQQARKIAKTVALFRDKGLAQAKQYAGQEKLSWPAQSPTGAQQLLEQLLHGLK